MIVKLLTEHYSEFLSLKGGCRGSSESTHVKMPHCWKSHAQAHIIFSLLQLQVEVYLTLVHIHYSRQEDPWEVINYCFIGKLSGVIHLIRLAHHWDEESVSWQSIFSLLAATLVMLITLANCLDPDQA